MKYGALPTDLGLVDLSPSEMMFWLYCPIKVPGWQISLPAQLEQFRPIVSAAVRDILLDGSNLIDRSYIYLTAKTLWVAGDYVGNRPGWHSDGFGTDDLNYIWSDRAPTEFLDLNPLVELSTDCNKSMVEMQTMAMAEYMRHPLGYRHTTFPDKHLLRLDQSVIHRSPDRFAAGMRTFVKVSISKDRYDLVGNSINHTLPASHWPLVNRKTVRNHPQSVHP